ncbi:MAG TPA: hypothetical protein VK926_04685 [Gaiellaceae bacterium]|nr:hypothetical protein [Gaiellaceae bacterium]
MLRIGVGGAAIAAMVIATVVALAVVTGGRAGSTGDGTTFAITVHPAYLTAGEDGFVVGRFETASGPGTGSATNVSMTFELDTDLLGPTATSTDCSTAQLVNGVNQITCQIGTVRAGQTVKRFVRFTASTASTALGSNLVSGSVSYDGGSSTSNPAPGGGVTIPDQGSTTIVAGGNSPHPDRAGSCDGTASTPAVSRANPMSTAVTGPGSVSGLPCPWVFVGENPPLPTATSTALTGISFFGFPETAPGQVSWEVAIDSLPVPFPQLKVKFDPNYEDGDTEFSGFDLPACVNGQLGENQTACLLSLVRVGRGAVATVLTTGTGGDPGVGFG